MLKEKPLTYSPRIGITMGDPMGIGPEIIVKALSSERIVRICRPVVFGDPGILAQTIQRLHAKVALETIDHNVPERGYSSRKLFLLPLSDLATPRVGGADRACGRAMVRYVEEAVRWVKGGKLDAITTCPLRKKAIRDAGYPFSGHTELLAHLAKAPTTAMMFVGSIWRVVFVSTHLPLRRVAASITKERVLSVLRLTERELKKYFGIVRPRIAVLGLNPHAGEGGLLGREEQKEIIPAIETAKSQGVDVEGPFPADSFFGLRRSSTFDAVVAMYHDQGLIPAKMADFEGSVNLTLGLPFIRTSVGHGTAYDIAGKGLANARNLASAIVLAAHLSKLTRKSK